MKPTYSQIRDQVLYKFFFGNGTEVTDDEVAYFREHPEEIDDFSAPLNIHKIFLFFGILLGICLVGVSKVLKSLSWLEAFSLSLHEFLVDIVFEVGVALIGAAVTAYLLGILLNRQQSEAKKWRTELRKRIKRSKKSP